jgi:hypothetical protein
MLRVIEMESLTGITSRPLTLEGSYRPYVTSDRNGRLLQALRHDR